MGAIVLDASKVNSYVLPSLVKSKNTMQDAYSTSVSLKNSLPSSFRYKNLVNDIVNQIYKSKKEINDVNSIISKKIDSAKNIESKNDNRASKISSMVSKIGAVSGTIGGAAIGAATGGVVGAAVGGVVGNKLGKTIADTGAKVASKVVSGVKKLGTSIVDGFKWVGSKVTSAYKSATSWISDKANKVSDWVSEKFDAAKKWTSKALKDTGAFIQNTGVVVSNVVKKTFDLNADLLIATGSTIATPLTGIWDIGKGIFTGNWNFDTTKSLWSSATSMIKAEDTYKRLGASIANGVISFVKGLVSLVEAIGDFVILLGSAASTINTVKLDIVKGIITGDWNFSTTKKLWDGTKAVVAYNWTNKIFDSLYDTKLGQTLDEYAYSPFKSDGMGCKIIEGVGYVAGVIALTIATFGVGGVATGAATTVSAGVSATTMSITATAAGVGKYTAEEWNKNSISINYGGTDIDIAMDYEKYTEIEKLKQGESTTISQQITLEDGSIQELIFNITAKGNGEYLITDKDGNVANLNGLNESSTAKGLAIGGLKAAWEGAQWYVGGKIGAGEFTKITGKVASPILKKVVTSGIRVGLDTATGVVEVPFQSLVTMMSEGKSWDEAWQSQGGWDAVKTQAGIAGISSFAGEALDLTKFLRNADTSNKNITSAAIDGKNAVDDVKPIDKQITKANYHTGKGRFAEIKINSLDDLNLEKINQINDINNTSISMGGNKYSVSQIKEMLDIQPEKIKEIVSQADIEKMITITTNVKNNPKLISDFVVECVNNGNMDSANLIFKNLDSSQLNSVLKHFDSISSGNIPYLVKNVFGDEINTIIKKITDGEIMFSFLNSYSTTELRQNFVSQLDEFQLKTLFNCAEDSSTQKFLISYMGIDQTKIILKDISMENFENIVKGLFSEKDYANLFVSIESFDQAKILVNQLSTNQFTYSNVLIELMNRNLDPSNILKMTDDSVLSGAIWHIPNESKIQFLKSLSDVVEIQRVVNSINGANWDSMVKNAISTGQGLDDLLRYIDNDNLVACIENLELSQAIGIIKSLNIDQLDYVKNNLEGTFKDNLAIQYQIREFYDVRVANLVDFAKTDMVNNFRDKFGLFVAPEKISALDGTYKFVNQERFAKMYDNERAMAYNDGTRSIMNLQYEDSIVMSNISHESIHQLSANDFIDANGNWHSARGLCVDGQNCGINECATEYLNELSMGDNYYTKVTGQIYCGYQEGVMKLKKLIDSGVIDQDKFIASYFSNDLGYLKSEIVKLSNEEYFDKLMKNFDDAISGDNTIRQQALESLDRMTSALATMKEMKL